MSEDDFPLLSFPDAESLIRWFENHGETCRGVLLRFSKIGAPDTTLSKSDAIDCALAFGWVDGQIGSIDAQYFKTRFTPRRSKSVWSQRNCDRVERLEQSGRMHASGRAQVEAAKADGRWRSAYPGQGKAEPTAELDAALDAEPAARELFETLDRANRYAILYRIQQAKTPEKRAAKIAEMVRMLRKGDTIHPRRG
jgi:uncharacterized protein YdeI (YjbR/CyaY-like superfamily)